MMLFTLFSNFGEYYWIEVLLGFIAIGAYSFGEWQDRITRGRHETDLKIERRRQRNKMIRAKEFNKSKIIYEVD